MKYCSAPFTSPSILPGGFKMCCMPRVPLWDSLDRWNDEEMQGIRRAFLRGEVPEACAGCYQLQDAMRGLADTRYGIPAEVVPVNFRVLSLARSNACNNACDMCSAELSTTYGRANGGYVRLENPFDLAPYAHEIEEVYVSGGNPVQDPGVLAILRLLDSAKVRHVMFTSNGSQFDRAFYEVLRTFKSVTLCVSIDGPADKNVIWRQFARPERYYQTLQTLLEWSAGDPHVAVTVQQTLTVRSAMEVIPLYQELCANLPTDRLRYNFNFCSYPEHLSLLNVDRRALVESIRAGAPALCKPYRQLERDVLAAFAALLNMAQLPAFSANSKSPGAVGNIAPTS